MGWAEELERFIDQVYTSTGVDFEALRIEGEELVKVGSDELSKRIDDIKERIRQEAGDLIADIVGYLLNSILNLVIIGGAGLGAGFGTLDVGRVLGQRLILKRLVDQGTLFEGYSIYIPSPQDTLELLHKGRIEEHEAIDIFKLHGINEGWFWTLQEASKPRVSPEQIRELYRRFQSLIGT